MVEIGDVVYLWVHAYLRLIGRVSAIHGQKRVSLEDASVVHADSEGYEQFFARGVDPEQTTTLFVGKVKDVTYLSAFDFPHPLPKRAVR